MEWSSTVPGSMKAEPRGIQEKFNVRYLETSAGTFSCTCLNDREAKELR